MVLGERSISNSAARKGFHAGSAAWLLLYAGVVSAPVAVGQEIPAGLFTEPKVAFTLQPSRRTGPGTLRSRTVQVDFKQLATARAGRQALKLNLFEDAVFEARITRVRPTRSGYFLTGPLKGVDLSEARLHVSGSMVFGEISSPEGSYMIRPDRHGRHIIRQIDASEILCETTDSGDFPFGVPAQGSDAGEVPSIRTGLVSDILVVYTTRAKNEAGGTAAMEALIDSWIASANAALNLTGLPSVLGLVHSENLSYTENGNNTNQWRILDSLENNGDGVMDEVHELRNQYEADLVAMIFDGRTSGSPDSGAIGNIFGAFSAISVHSPSHTFAHELGHNFGLRHDRYQEHEEGRPTPSDADHYGYVNLRAFDPGAPNSSRWSTLMGL